MAQIKKKGECSSDQEGKGALSAALPGYMLYIVKIEMGREVGKI